MQLVADTVGNNADAVGNIADGVENIADGIGNHFFLVLPRKDRMKSPIHP